jgi:hypothetical protein
LARQRIASLEDLIEAISNSDLRACLRALRVRNQHRTITNMYRNTKGLARDPHFKGTSMRRQIGSALRRYKQAVLSEYGSFEEADIVIVRYQKRKFRHSLFLDDDEMWPGYPLNDVCRYHSLERWEP